jgi:hypothetical protein
MCRLRGRNRVVVAQSSTPVNCLQFALLIDSEGVSCFTCIDAEDAALLEKANCAVGLLSTKCGSNKAQNMLKIRNRKIRGTIYSLFLFGRRIWRSPGF